MIFAKNTHNSHLNYTIESTFQPVILNGKALNAVTNELIHHIKVYKKLNSELHLITYQIDQKDNNGIYILNEIPDKNALFDSNDEIAFMSSDAGEQINDPKETFRTQSVVEIQITQLDTNTNSWAYIVANNQNPPSHKNMFDYVHYNSKSDSIITSNYKIGFSKNKAFLLNQLRFKDTQYDSWSDNYVTGLLLLHKAKIKLFHSEFKRTGKDYSSRIVATKDGPIRVIRRTANRIDILPIIGLKTPSLYIDIIAYQNVFNVDSIIDFPVPLGWAFYDAITDIQFQWNQKLSNSSIVYTQNFQEGAIIDGISRNENKLNALKEKKFIIKTPSGSINASIKKGESLPIDYYTKMTDNLNSYGLIGFHTNQWEYVSADIHHMLFTLTITPNNVLAVRKKEKNPSPN